MVAECVGTCCIGAWGKGIGGIWLGMGGNMVVESVSTCRMATWGQGIGGIWLGMGEYDRGGCRNMLHRRVGQGHWGNMVGDGGEYGRGECRYMSHGHVGPGDLGNMVGDGGAIWSQRVLVHVGWPCGTRGLGKYGWGWGEYGRIECRYMLRGRVVQGDGENMVGDGGIMVAECVGTCCIGTWGRRIGGIWLGIGGIWSRRVSVHVAWPRGAWVFGEYGRGWGQYGRGGCRYMLHRHVGQGHWGNMVGDGGNMVAESVGTCCIGVWGRGIGGIWLGMGGNMVVESVGTCRMATWGRGIWGIWSGMGAIWSQRVLVHVAWPCGTRGLGKYGWGWREYGRIECRYMLLGRVVQGDGGNMVGDGGIMVAEFVGTCCIGTWGRRIGGIWLGIGGIWSRRVSVHVAWPRGGGGFGEYGRGWGQYGRRGCWYMSHGHVGPGHWGNMVGDGGNMVAECVGTCCIGAWGRGIGGIWSGENPANPHPVVKKVCSLKWC